MTGDFDYTFVAAQKMLRAWKAVEQRARQADARCWELREYSGAPSLSNTAVQLFTIGRLVGLQEAFTLGTAISNEPELASQALGALDALIAGAQAEIPHLRAEHLDKMALERLRVLREVRELITNGGGW